MRSEFTAIQSAINALAHRYFKVHFTDINTAGSRFFPCPFAGLIVGIISSIDAANSGSATLITVEIATVAVTQAAHSIPIGGGIGSVVAETAVTATNVVADRDSIEVITDGAGTPAIGADIIVVIDHAAPA